MKQQGQKLLFIKMWVQSIMIRENDSKQVLPQPYPCRELLRLHSILAICVFVTEDLR